MGEPNEHYELETPGEPDAAPSPAPAAPAPATKPVPPPPAPPRPEPEKVPSLLELAEDECPKCGTVLSPSAVFCIKCGYDMRTNEVRTPRLGVEHVEEKPAVPEHEKVFSAEGRGNLNVLLGVGAALTVGAMVVAGLKSPPGFFTVAASVVLSLYETVLHTGTGLVAVLIAARLADLRPGRLDLAVARIFVAFASFQLLHQVTFGEYQILVTILMYAAALAAYWGLVMLLFRKPRMVAVTVMVAHFLLWIAVTMGIELAKYVEHKRATTVVVERQVPVQAPPGDR
jgi:hypothetical protein